MNRGIRTSISTLAMIAAALACAVMLLCTTTPTDPDCVGDDCKVCEGDDCDPCTGDDCCEGDDCGGPGDDEWKFNDSWTPSDACTERSANVPDRDAENLGFGSEAVTIVYKNGDAPVVTLYPTALGAVVPINIDGEHVTVESRLGESLGELRIIVSGKTENGSLRIRGARTQLYLNGVSIKNPDGPAIYNVGNVRLAVNLVGGCDRKNYLEDGVNYIGTFIDAKGLLFNEGTLNFSGGGYLELRSKYRHAIVSDENVRIDSVDIVIRESAADGIHANEDIEISGGVLQILCAGDAIQSERDANTTGITVSGGKITMRTTGVKSHGLASETDVHISGSANISITATGKASKGIRARGSATIIGGSFYAATSGDQIVMRPGDEGYDPADTTSSAAGVKAANFTMSGGTLKTLNIGDNSKGLSIDNTATITGGNATIRARGDGIKVDGNLTINGGKVYTESAEKKGIDCKGSLNLTPDIVTEKNQSGAIK